MGRLEKELVWVLGADGLLGSTWTSWLRSQGFCVVATKRDPDLCLPAEVDLFLSRMEQPPVFVINCAALTGYDRCEKNPERAFATNAEGPELLGQLAHKYGFKLIHFSSDCVFEGAGGERFEGSMPAARSVYAQTKLEGEGRLLKVCPQSLIIRSSWLFGHHQPNFLLRILHSMATEETLHVVEDQIGRPTSVLDLVTWTWALRHKHGIWHLANQGEASWFSFAQQVLQLAQRMDLPIQCREILPIQHEQLLTKRPASCGATLNTEKAERFGLVLRPWQLALGEILEGCFVEFPSELHRETR